MESIKVKSFFDTLVTLNVQGWNKYEPELFPVVE